MSWDELGALGEARDAQALLHVIGAVRSPTAARRLGLLRPEHLAYVAAGVG